MHDIHSAGASELVLGHDYEGGRGYWARYLMDVASRDLPHERNVHWNTTQASLDSLLEHATHSSALAWGAAALLDLEGETGCIAVVSLSRGGGVQVQLAAATAGALAHGEAFVRERLPERVPTADQTVPIVFWSHGPHGPSEMSRSIGVPSWGDIRDNYPSVVAAQLERLMQPEYRPDGRGQLILWYGEPGTGKTYSLRGLGWQCVSGARCTTSPTRRRSSGDRTTCST